jgi:DNA-binding CsgD family transcriptional regulator
MMNSTLTPDAGLFFNSILESLIDGILITKDMGRVLYANTIAQQLCRQISPDSPESPDVASPQSNPEASNPEASNPEAHVPDEILKLHEFMLEDPEQSLILESELTIAHQTYRVRVQRIDLAISGENCLLTRIENQAQSSRCLAHLEAQQYGLTSREEEVWTMRRQKLSRQEIAQSLHVSIDTVKKHLGNIQMKRQSYMDRA